MPETGTLLVSCPDQKGLVSGVSSFHFRQGGNILQSDQYTDLEAVALHPVFQAVRLAQGVEG